MKSAETCHVSLEIAGLVIRIETGHPLLVNDRFAPFRTEKQTYDWMAVFHKESELPAVTGSLICERASFSVYNEGVDGFMRVFHTGDPDKDPYGVGRYDWKRRYVDVTYLPKGEQFFSGLGNGFFHLAWETLLLRERRLIFHAAFADTPYGGVLFSGPSGIGKSTQADLWCRRGAAKLINGDRPILQKTESGWIGWGAPYAGSSHCFFNESRRITAIVMLQQAPQCRIRRLRPSEAFRRVYAQLTLNSWDPENVRIAVEVVEALIRDITVFELFCTPDEAAVEILEAELKKVIS